MTIHADQFVRSTETVIALMRSIEPDHWAQPTPCDGWTVRELVDHLLAIPNYALVLLGATDGEDATIREPADVLAGGLARVQEALAQTDLTRHVPTPMGELALDEAVGALGLETLIHGWDLARATSQEFCADHSFAAELLAQLEPMSSAISQTGMYGQQLTIDDTDPMSKLLALLGRDPAAP